MEPLPNVLLQLVAYELEDIYDYNALRATNSGVKLAIDQSVLKRPFFFSIERKHWIGRYSRRVFDDKYTKRLLLLITHPIIIGKCKEVYKLLASYPILNDSTLIECVCWLIQSEYALQCDGSMFLREGKGDPSFRMTLTPAESIQLRSDVRGELQVILNELKLR